VSDIVVLVGNPRGGSRTRALAEAATAALSPAVAGLSLSGPTTLDLSEIVAVTFGPEAVAPTAPVDGPHATVKAARLLVVATPTHKGSYTGLLKIFFDQYGHRELTGTVAVPVAIAASESHRAAVGAALTTLLDELGAAVPAPALSILEPDAADPARAAQAWAERHGAVVAAALAAQVASAG
jgi:FMN reductase